MRLTRETRIRLSALTAALFLCGSATAVAPFPLGRCQKTVKPTSSARVDVLAAKLQSLDGSLPAEVLDDYSVNEMAEALVSKIGAEHLRRDHPGWISQDLMSSETQLHIRFQPSSIDGIVEKGSLNQHQTLSSNNPATLLDPAYRSRSEDFMAGLKLSSESSNPQKVNALRPKYGIVQPAAGYPSEAASYVHSYGAIVAVLKNDLKKRTTFSLGETARSVAFHKNDRGVLFETFGTMDMNEVPSGVDRGSSNVRLDEEHIEAQVWGEISPGDIDYFMIQTEAGGFRDWREVVSEDRGRWTSNGKVDESWFDYYVRELKKAGIPVYRGRLETSGKMSKVIRGDRL